jgi:hypothetical protein
MFPSWFKTYTGPPASEASADGAIFYAHLGSNIQGSLAEQKASFRVYVFVRRGATFEEVPIDVARAPNNQASFRRELDGTLTLVGTRDGILIELPIPGYVAPAQEAATPLYEPPYSSQAELDSPPGEFVRFNKLKDAVLQLRRQARKAGWLV